MTGDGLFALSKGRAHECSAARKIRWGVELLTGRIECPARDRGITTLLRNNIADCDGQTQNGLTRG